jgi:hypothetical protein
MLAAVSTASEITTVIVLFFVLMALLTFLRLLLRKAEPIWREIRLGVFIERKQVDDPPDDDNPLPPTTWQKS